MLDLAQAPELPAEAEASIDTAGDDMFAELHRDLQAAKVKKLTAYFAKTPTQVGRVTQTASGVVLLHLVKCWNKPEEHDGGDPCVCVRTDGSHFWRCFHKNCSGLTWKDVEEVYGPLDPAPEPTQAEPTNATNIRVLTAAQIASECFPVKYLIDGLWVEHQPGPIGGAKKVLKTCLMLDMAVSLPTGRPFLGQFAVLDPCPVLVLSAESGLSTIQETLLRICAAKGIRLAHVDGFYLSEWVPLLDSVKHLEALEKLIEATGCRVLFLDPIYMALGPRADPANLFAQGYLLRQITEVCQRHGVSLVILHHFRKRAKNDRSYEVPELDDLTWSGFSEWSRQWLLIGRREAYEAGSGQHRLWLSAGGSAGHGGLWALDVDEGPSGQPRHWKVSLSTPSEVREEKKENTVRQRILDAVREFAQGETKTGILTVAKVKPDTAVRDFRFTGE